MLQQIAYEDIKHLPKDTQLIVYYVYATNIRVYPVKWHPNFGILHWKSGVGWNALPSPDSDQRTYYIKEES